LKCELQVLRQVLCETRASGPMSWSLRWSRDTGFDSRVLVLQWCWDVAFKLCVLVLQWCWDQLSSSASRYCASGYSLTPGVWILLSMTCPQWFLVSLHTHLLVG